MTGERDDSAFRREEPDDARAELVVLRRAISALAAATDLETSTSVLLSLGLQTVDDAGGAVLAAPGADGALDVLDSTYGTDVISRLQGMAITHHSPLTDALLRGEAVWIENEEELDTRYPQRLHGATRSAPASVAFPMRVGGRVVGVLGVTWPEPRRFRDADRMSVQNLADMCAVVFDRHALFEAEHAARSAAATGIMRAGTLGRVTDVVHDASDDATIASTVVDAAIDAITADAALVALRDEDDEIAIVHSVGYSDEALACMREALDAIAREPVFWHHPDPYPARSPHPEAVRELTGARAWAIVPLVSGGHDFGFFTVLLRTPHDFDSEERGFLDTVADIAAHALVRARSRTAERQARRSAETLADGLAEERARLAAVLDQMPAALVVVEAATGEVALSNRLADAILGPAGVNVERNEWLALHRLDGEPYAAGDLPLSRALRRGETVIGEQALVLRDHLARRQVSASALPVHDQEGRVTSAVLVIEDVTEQARRERDTNLLAAVGDAFASEAELEVLLERLAALAISTFADVCGVYVLGDDALHMLSIHGVDPAVTDEARHLFSLPVPLDDDNPLSIALADGTPRVYDVELDTLFARRDVGKSRREWLDRVLRSRSLLVVPMRVRNRTIGLLAFTYTAESERAYTADDLEVGAELARRCALILDQVSAHAETARARDRADRLQRFAAAMARAASVDAVVRGVVHEGADAIGADLANLALPAVDSASLRVYHAPRNATDMADWARVALDADIPITHAARRGRPVYLRDVDEFAAAFPKSLDSLLGSDMESVVALPLAGSEGEIIGSVAFAFTEPRAFDAAQRTLLETIADIAAQSLDRAQLYERERDAAQTLQVALLPAALPQLDGITIEARYVAGGAGVTVGGDWYDVLPFPDGRIGLVIGDAAGRGIDAATLMGKVRHAAAALAMEHESPAIVMQRVNDYLHAISSPRTMLTCCYIVVDQRRATLRYAVAGHPPVAVIPPDGDPVFLDKSRGVPLGVVPDARYDDASYSLVGPSTLVLYTDGLIERRGESIDVGLERLRTTLVGYREGLGALCEHLTSTLLPGSNEDDVALLVASMTPRSAPALLSLELPPDASRLHELRHRIAEWLEEAGVADAVIPEIVIAVNEAVSNSMLHAYQDAEPPGPVRVSVAVGEDGITATVSDQGRWRAQPANHDGRGLELMSALMSDVRVETDDRGTLVRLVRVISSA